MADMGVSRGALARSSGLSPSFLRAILAERSPLSSRAAVRIAIALGLDPEHYLLAKARHETSLVIAELVSEPETKRPCGLEQDRNIPHQHDIDHR